MLNNYEDPERPRALRGRGRRAARGARIPARRARSAGGDDGKRVKDPELLSTGRPCGWRATTEGLGVMNPYVFIVGCARSGTTLLRRMINAHPHITMTQARFIPIFFEKRTGLTPEGFVTPELIPKLLEYRKFPRMKVGREELEGLINSDEPLSDRKSTRLNSSHANIS